MQLLYLFLGIALASPSQPHELHYVKRAGGKYLPFFYPKRRDLGPTVFAGFVSATNLTLDKLMDNSQDYLSAKVGVNKKDLVLTNLASSKNNSLVSIYHARKINGYVVANHNTAVHYYKGRVLSQWTSFTAKTKNFVQNVSPAVITVPLEKAVEIAEKTYGISRDSQPAYNVYLELPGNKLVFTHVFQLRDDETNQWLQVFSDTLTGQIVQVIDFVHKLSFQGIKLPGKDPSSGISMIFDPENQLASPKGWTQSTQTIGNNVDSRLDSGRRTTSSNGIFSSNYSPNSPPTTTSNQNSAIINSFYITNMVHDITYQYGFDEPSGNFQYDNFGRGGLGKDPVLVLNQVSGNNNAYFTTPPDGQQPTLSLFTWTMTDPNRDGSLYNPIIIHEYGHGISTRLTGGAMNSNCLNSDEASGLGEGWSDMFAIIFTQSAEQLQDYAMGSYLMGNDKGVRMYAYSTNMDTNPLMFSNVADQSSAHDVGTTWATMLFEVLAGLLDVYGYAPDLYNAKQLKGNIITLQIIITGMKLQPCNPTLSDARDAILQADVVHYGGKNKCVLWKAFAKRGLGMDADQNNYTNGFKVPEECLGDVNGVTVDSSTTLTDSTTSSTLQPTTTTTSTSTSTSTSSTIQPKPATTTAPPSTTPTTITTTSTTLPPKPTTVVTTQQPTTSISTLPKATTPSSIQTIAPAQQPTSIANPQTQPVPNPPAQPNVSVFNLSAQTNTVTNTPPQQSTSINTIQTKAPLSTTLPKQTSTTTQSTQSSNTQPLQQQTTASQKTTTSSESTSVLKIQPGESSSALNWDVVTSLVVYFFGLFLMAE